MLKWLEKQKNKLANLVARIVLSKLKPKKDIMQNLKWDISVFHETGKAFNCIVFKRMGRGPPSQLCRAI